MGLSSSKANIFWQKVKVKKFLSRKFVWSESMFLLCKMICDYLQLNILSCSIQTMTNQQCSNEYLLISASTLVSLSSLKKIDETSRKQLKNIKSQAMWFVCRFLITKNKVLAMKQNYIYVTDKIASGKPWLLYHG